VYKAIAVILVSFALFGCASSSRVPDTFIETEYTPPKVEDTPHFQRLKTLLETDGYTYTHYEIGAGLVVWGTLNRTNKGYGSKDEGIRRIPGDVSKAYYISWDQYFMAFSDMHKICFDEKNIREIKRVVDQLVLDTDYDYSRLYKLSDGAQWVFHPGVKYFGVCDDYADLVYEKLSGLPGVSEIYKVSSAIGNHSWNEILLDDGRIIYLDATWYDTNGYYVDPKSGNYIVEHDPHYMPTMFTFDKDLFSLGGTHYNWGDAVRSPGKSASLTVIKYDTSDRRVEFDFHLGAYINVWHENFFSLGMPLQIGVKLNFANMALSVLGEGGIGLGVPSVTKLSSPLLEWNYGGMGEFYFPGKKIGVGFGYGLVDSYLIQIRDLPTSQTFKSTYMRFAFILRGKSKLTLYGNLYGSGNWGFGVMWN